MTSGRCPRTPRCWTTWTTWARARSIPSILGLVERHFDALPIDADVAREWGRLSAAVTNRGAQPRRRALDLAIAATANVHRATLLTRNIKDFTIIADLVDVRDL
jgi:hypothetical protein